MKTIVLSDLHGYLPLITEGFDLMLICGDICPVDRPHTNAVQKDWIFSEFVGWVNQLPFKNGGSRVVMCAGNHDRFFEGVSKTNRLELSVKTGHRLKYLDNEEYIYEYLDDEGNLKDYRIFGCPYCKVFGNWAFMRENLDKYYSYIPEGLDFLICHDAPDVNGLGEIKAGRWAGENAGNPVLAKYVKEAKPKYCFNGHIHSGTHEMFEEDGTKFCNVSIMDESYNPVYKPLVLNID